MSVAPRRRGFSLVELLIALAVIGIIAAIAIPNLISAIERGRQKRTMSDMRSLSTAWEARATDYNRYNAAGYVVAPNTIDCSALLSPTYIRDVPSRDGWNHLFVTGADAAQASATTLAARYQIVSYGRDGAVSTSSPDGGTTNFDCDIVLENGAFKIYPEGVQQ
jgi:prepilin-type N-terminal cleavage/methylation domain-containing protein